MKFLFTLLLCACFSQILNAQDIQAPRNFVGRALAEQRVHRPFANSDRGVIASYLEDYDVMEWNYYNMDTSSYQGFVWSMNSRFKASEGDTSIDYFVVAYNKLYDDTGGLIYNNTINSLTVDSIFLTCGWENNSGMNDTLILSLVQLTAAGFPTNTVLWADTAVTATGATANNDFLDIATYEWAPAYTTTTQKRIGLKVEFFGSKLDTFGFAAAFPAFHAACGTSSNALLANKSLYYPNSYIYYSRYGPQYGVLPNAAGGDIFYDCDGDHAFTAGVDGASYIQNVQAGLKITLDYNAGVKNLSANISSVNLYPNPAAAELRVRYVLSSASNVTVSVYDVTGRELQHNVCGKQASGSHALVVNSSTLSAGAYMVRVQTENGSVYQKFVKQ